MTSHLPQRLWTRLALAMSLTTLLAALVFVGAFYTYEWVYEARFKNQLPPDILQRYETLVASPDPDAAELISIYEKYDITISSWEPVQHIVFWFAVAVLAAGSLGIWLARRISAPIAEVARVARALSTYQLSARAVPTSSALAGSEIATLVSDINQLSETLQRDERKLREQAAAIAHEFRTPLSVLTARLQAMKDGLVRPDTVEIDKLLRQVDGLTRIVEDQRTISLASAGQINLILKPVDLIALVDRCAENLKPFARSRNASIVVRHANLTIRVRADEARVQQMLTNLIDNAIRHGGQDAIILSTDVAAGDAIIGVRDHGSGFDPTIQDTLFEPFTRSDASRSRDSGGSGLGLAVVAELMKVHGGKATAQNAHGGGALIGLHFPLM